MYLFCHSKKNISILVLCILFSTCVNTHAYKAKVVKVSDGDTITVLTPDKKQVRVRLYGIDAPERGQAYSGVAQRYLSVFVAGDVVDIEEMDKDRYGRTVAIVRAKNTIVNKEMIYGGCAWVYDRYCKDRRCKNWKKIERTAQRERRGLWSDRNPVKPWEWRKKRSRRY